MTHMTPLELEAALLPPGTPTFAVLIARLAEAEDLSAERRRDLTSGLRCLARALDHAVEEIPADPRWLQPRIAQVMPVAVGLSAKRWTNVVSDARAAIAHCGILERRNHLRVHLGPEWRRLWDQVLAREDKSLQVGLGPFVHFLNRLEIAPENVDESHAATYRAALERNAINRSPDVSWRAAINGWNRVEAQVPEWPRLRLSMPSRRNTIALPLDTFPASFEADLGRYLDGLAHPDPLDPKARLEGIRPSSLKARRIEVIRFASMLVRAGKPAEDVVSLAALVEPARAEQGLRALLARNGNKKNTVVAKAAEMLRQVAKTYVEVDDDTQTALDDFARRLTMPWQAGMTAKNRNRLRQFDDPEALRRLLLLPERLMTRANTVLSSFRSHLDRETAVAIAILLACPIRVGNLDRIHLERNLQRSKGGRAYLVFEAAEVKNDRRVEFDLPPQVLSFIDRHLALRAPGLCPHGTPWLFPSRDGSAPLDQNHLAKRICQTIRREAGIDMHVHLFRHFAAKLWLEEYPGAYEGLKRLLGHSALSSTLNAYAGFEAGTATRLFAEVVEKRRRG